MLATAFHETDRKMQAIEEYGKGTGKVYGKPDAVTGEKYYGRGLVQLTWKDNYEFMGKQFKVPLVANPKLALNSEFGFSGQNYVLRDDKRQL